MASEQAATGQQAASAEKPKIRSRAQGAIFYDYSLIFVIIFLLSFGLMMIYSTSYYTAQLKIGDGTYYMRRQMWISLVGLAGMVIMSKMDYHFLMRFTIPVYAAAAAFMILVDFVPGFGKELNGKKRWFMIRNRALFQPAEMVKLAVIMMMALLLAQLKYNVDSWKATVFVGLMAAFPVALIIFNNLSSAVIVAGIAALMYFVASRRKLRFAVVIGLIALVVVLFVVFGEKLVDMGLLQGYRLTRIRVWQHPEAYPQDGGYQVLQGLYAIGSGGLFGKGLGNSTQKLGFVPEAQNDMIFTIICEELGLFGAFLVIALFMVMLYRFVVIARNAPDKQGFFLVVGVLAHISIQVVLNIAVVSNKIPNTGVTLPFISYGGTSVLFLLAEMGLVLSVSNQIRLKNQQS